MMGSSLAVVFRAILLLASLAAAPVAGAAPSAPIAAPAPPAAKGGFDPKQFGAAQLLVVHYHRADGDYRAWNLWAWPEGKDGAAFAFQGTDEFGAWAAVPLRAPTAKVGFIVRQGDWVAKDVEQDRFVVINPKQPVTQVWLVAGDPSVYVERTQVDVSRRVTGAFLDARDRVTLAMTMQLDDSPESALRVIGPDGRDVAVTRREPLAVPGSPNAVVTLRLAKPVADDAIGALAVKLGDQAPVPVVARGVLDDAAFQALDADLGARCTPAATTFTTWSPVSTQVELVLLPRTGGADPARVVPLDRGPKGTWTTTLREDLHGTPYRYRFHHGGRVREAADIHCFAATADSQRSVVIDLDRVKPDAWDTTPAPTAAHPTDEVIYELHVRDFSVADPSCPERARGSYLGLVHPGSVPGAPAGPASSTGLAHLRDLGITAVHLMPVHDFTAGTQDYNWGYWTALFNVPEGNYATDRGADPLTPVRELRTAVQGLHAAGIRVLLDVVYNHTSSSGDASPFDATVPGWFFRTTPDGRLTNDAGCGNSVADERPMVRKYILDSLAHWLRDYKVDGFRFDLLGTHTPETVRAICARVKELRPDATLYGEPWTGGGPIRFGKGAQKGLPIAVFNDHLRGAVRGDTDGAGAGFATGPGGDSAAVLRGAAFGAIDDFTQEPGESVAYVSAHDNLSLVDKIAKAAPTADAATRRAMQKLALGIVLVSQGVPFLEGGSEICRTKGGDHNSYVSGDAVNRFDWQAKPACDEVFEWTRGMVALRRAHPALHLDTAKAIRASVKPYDAGPVVAWTIDGAAAKDPAKRLLVLLNGDPVARTVKLPVGEWGVLADDRGAGVNPRGTVKGTVSLAPYGMFVAAQGLDARSAAATPVPAPKPAAAAAQAPAPELLRQAMEAGVARLVAMQEDPGQWPYEGVYRVGGKIPVGYRIGGTAICAEALLRAPGFATDAPRKAAVERAVAFVCAGIKEPLMSPDDYDGGYDVRGWGMCYGARFLVAAVQLGAVPTAQLADAKRAAQWYLDALQSLEIPKVGGWAYARGPSKDAASPPSPFMTAPCLQTLYEARAAGFAVLPDVVDRGLKALESCAAERSGFVAYAGKTTGTTKDDPGQIPGAVGRMVATESTLFLAGRSSPERLERAVTAFCDHWDALAARRAKPGTHLPPYGVAPYYFQYAHVHAAQAIALLPAERRAPLWARFDELLFRTRADDGTWNDRVFPRSANYGTATAVMSLLYQLPAPPMPAAWKREG